MYPALGPAGRMWTIVGGQSCQTDAIDEIDGPSGKQKHGAHHQEVEEEWG
jgi:hypothetical protein